ncbi:DinB family protein [Robertkochia sediminum]|uniref:DinB family protein n=1 Tax=Robertkochia sediminum TaxID=2785326 RepID=UPI0019340306|nr:DinB family protein [Robertkochia sediminum]MBL7472243.1 DinB family protein [Robertkochia sediminum]
MAATLHNEESKYLAQQLGEVLLHGTWVANTNFKEVIKDLSLDEALYKPNTNNSIALLVFHINYYMQGVLEVFRGGPLNIHDKYSFDMPPLRSEADWQHLKNSFLKNSETFIATVRATIEAQWQQTFVKAEYGTYRRNIDGFIAHSYYHLGQAVLIKKMVRNS